MYRKKNNYMKYKKDYKSKPLKNLDKRVSKIEGEAELKHIDHYENNLSVPDTPPEIVHISGISQGIDTSQRIGNEVNVTSLQFRAILRTNVLQLATSTVRMLIVKDKGPDGAAPSIGQILDTTTISRTTIAPYNRNNSDRFKIIYDKLFSISPNGTRDSVDTAGNINADVLIEKELNFKKKFKMGHKMKFTGTGSGLSFVASNSLLFIVLGALSTNVPTITIGTRMYYKDC